MMAVAQIALGANIPSPAGEPAATLRAALAVLAAMGELRAVSGLYRTAPVGYHDQPDFVNAAATLATEMTPHELLLRLLDVEQEFGRDRESSQRNGPRPLDLDLLLYDDVVMTSNLLELPHPRMHERLFVLEPLAEIAAEARHPVLRQTVAELLAAARARAAQHPEQAAEPGA